MTVTSTVGKMSWSSATFGSDESSEAGAAGGSAIAVVVAEGWEGEEEVMGGTASSPSFAAAAAPVSDSASAARFAGWVFIGDPAPRDGEVGADILLVSDVMDDAMMSNEEEVN